MTKNHIRPHSDFYWGALAMKAAMLAIHDVHAANVELGFPPRLVLKNLREHMEMITPDMVAQDRNQNITDGTD